MLFHENTEYLGFKVRDDFHIPIILVHAIFFSCSTEEPRKTIGIQRSYCQSNCLREYPKG